MEAPGTLPSPPWATITPAPSYRPEPWPPVFLLGARPLSVDGHIFTVDEQVAEGGYRFRIDCPTANVSTDYRTPEDDDGDEQCRRAGLFPAEVYHDNSDDYYGGDSIWGGVFSPPAAPARTWRCEMPDPFLGSLAIAAGPFAAGNCSQWESATSGAAAAATAATTTTVSLDRCAMLRGRVPLASPAPGARGTGRITRWALASRGTRSARTASTSGSPTR